VASRVELNGVYKPNVLIPKEEEGIPFHDYITKKGNYLKNKVRLTDIYDSTDSAVSNN